MIQGGLCCEERDLTHFLLLGGGAGDGDGDGDSPLFLFLEGSWLRRLCCT